ncbi:copper chaperone PCu(A)C [Sphingobium aquiterrae]|uniref:copper chaperone PCu(A)C n=1 Tax=Sphingobium aquiterrae TaxID=2038656 RepID=UPI0030165B6E
MKHSLASSKRKAGGKAGLCAVAILALPLALSACGDPQPLYVDQAWVRLSPNPGNPSAGYFTVHGGPQAVQLRGVITDRAQRIEMHESMKHDGMMVMQPIESVDIAAKAEVTFAPGGKHIMLWGVNPTAVQQGTMPLTFLFSNGDRIIVDAVIRKPSDGAPAPAANASGAKE